ncbi:MAG: EAL domain-containing protein [Burkholderiaceae bacterium]
MDGNDFSILFELLPIGAYRSSRDGKMLRANAALVRLNGYDSEAALRAAVNDIGTEWYVEADARARFMALIERDGRVINFCAEIYRHKTRERGWIVENAHLLYAADGSVLCYEGTVEDVTEARQANVALRESEERWKLALESAGDGVWDWDIQTGIETYSRRFQEMYGFAEGELGNKTTDFDGRTHPDDRLQRDRNRDAHMQGHTDSYVNEHRVRCKDGSWKWALSRGMVIRRDAQGRPLRMIGTHTDINARKNAETALRTLYEELAHKTLLLQTTLGSISQGIFMIDADGRLGTYNARVRELLDLPDSLLAARPTLQEITQFQLGRGDFGPGVQLVDLKARGYVAAAGNAPIPQHYLRTTQDGRTLEVRSQPLSDGRMVRTFADVSDYVQAERSRKRLDLLLEATQALAQVGGWEVDVPTHQVFWTDEVYRILETSPEEYTPNTETSMQFFTPESAALVAAAINDAETVGKPHDMELEMVTAKGRRIWVHSVSTVSRENGKVRKRTSVIQDITERKRAQTALQESEDRWKLALEGVGDGVWDWYMETGVEIFSPRFKKMYGYSDHEIADRCSAFDQLTHPDDIAQVNKARQAHFDGITPTYINEHRIRCKDGSWKWILSRGMVISRDALGKPVRMIGTHTDISERKNSEAMIWQQANFDTLTGLPNRRMLRDRLEQKIKESDREGQELAVLFIDLDHFKEVNDTLGHDAGDSLLVEAARRIRHCVRESDTVARMGGDEFTIVLAELHEAPWLDRVMHSLLTAMSALFQIGNEQVYVSASIGITMYPADAREVEDLFKNADQALYVAKGAGRNRFSFFTPALQEAAQNRVRLANELRQGLAEQQFRVAYQPIVDLRDGSIRKAEALIRWQHPTRGTIDPSEFIPVAESSGLIVEIGEWVFHQAAAQAGRWRAMHHPTFQVSVNKSPVQFHNDAGRQHTWVNHLKELGLGGDSVVVEITEGLLLDTSASVTEQLLQLRDAGIQVSLDDFGTGYSSLTYLQRFDIDFIKIDQSFVRHLIPECTELALCKAIIVMAHELGMQVIAEGVETASQRDLLAAAGCDFGQGYLFSRALPADEFDAFMQDRPASGL